MSPLRALGVLNREGMKSFNSGRNDDALFQLIQAERLARTIGSPLHEAKVRNNIGLVYQGAGSPMEALTSFRLAAEQAVRGAGEDTQLHKVIVRNLVNLETTLRAEAV
ncbi:MULTISPECIES: tetratricopeptide repeat protein [unclassified Pseudodesulfovibrio]|uniref:tetratricopeptide repeat protein n=1 Tax=unclassified Pseudodesulfovibrio TaxID=2661612 RepID=UPI000FEC0A99|nr:MULTISPECIES: tetratricopeptide repeat protein [unclassified Pseudodesulfovibrio]MCJ2165365.1 tetratricopeptide repeat protein [Pseudodesulfovibrio sp. S3-i]RWU02828.1 tetratricopeptide repeat protein [Pseudodesulfovibrio sp. S3]